MPRSKKIATYPQEFISLAMSLETASRELIFATKREAESARLELYGLRKAIISEGAEEVYKAFCTCRMVIEMLPDCRFVLKLALAEDTAIVKAIMKALQPAQSLTPEQQEQRVAQFHPSKPTEKPTLFASPENDTFEGMVDSWLNEGRNPGTGVTDIPQAGREPDSSLADDEAQTQIHALFRNSAEPSPGNSPDDPADEKNS